ncbi:MAG: VacJ family lipoprotein [Deltaproteobacteria bacterium]|nr:VacJ family lipoprotein [Deltaproteobacteria bacterium]
MRNTTQIGRVSWLIALVFLFYGVLASVPSAKAMEPDEAAQTAPMEADEDEYDLMDEDEFDLMDEDDMSASASDPLEKWNRGVFVFNDKCYERVLKPVGKGYRKIFPESFRQGVDHFFFNLVMPVRFVNCLLQGKGQAAMGEMGRFCMNTTVGVLGFANPAGNYPALNPDPEDLGQTFGRYGIGNGFYLVLPLLGPSTLRDAIGMVGDLFLRPTFYLDPREAAFAARGVDVINGTSLSIEDIESLKAAALEPYSAFRDAYLQMRQSKVGK